MESQGEGMKVNDVGPKPTVVSDDIALNGRINVMSSTLQKATIATQVSSDCSTRTDTSCLTPLRLPVKSTGRTTKVLGTPEIHRNCISTPSLNYTTAAILVPCRSTSRHITHEDVIEEMKRTLSHSHVKQPIVQPDTRDHIPPCVPGKWDARVHVSFPLPLNMSDPGVGRMFKSGYYALYRYAQC